MDFRIVDGRLTRDAEVKINKTNGNKFLTFTLANNGFSKGEQTTTFFNVVSYNTYDIERLENFTKGTLVVVSGRPNESMTIKDNKTYLNRNIMAHSIEKGTPSATRENQPQTTYRDVAPIGSTPEIQQLVSQVSSPTVNPVSAPVVEQPKATYSSVIGETYQQAQQPKRFEESAYMTDNSDDELPF